MGSVGTFLVNCFVGGTWKTQRARKKTTLVIEPFETLRKGHRDAVAEEGERLARFMAHPKDAEAPEVRLVEAT